MRFLAILSMILLTLLEVIWNTEVDCIHIA